MENEVKADVKTNLFNQVVSVDFKWEDYLVPFGLGRSGKPYRLDYDQPDRPRLPRSIYGEMFKQTFAIFGQTRPYVIKEVKLIKPAALLHEKITASLESDNLGLLPTFKEWQKTSWEIIRRENNPEITDDNLTDEEMQWLKLLRQNGVTVLTEGWFSIRHWTRSENNRRLTPLKVKGINSALRLMLEHIPEYYYKEPRQELDSLETMEEVLLEANNLLSAWGDMKAEDKKELRLKIVQIVLRLHNCKNFFMQKVKKQLVNTVSLKDRLGRPNPTVMIIRLDKASEKLTERLQEIKNILPRMALRREMLILEKRRLEINLKHAATTIKVLSNHRLFNDGKAGSRDFTDVDKRLNQALSFMRSLWVSPYWELAEQARPNLYRAKQLIDLGKIAEAKKMLLKTYMILKTDMSQYG